MPRPKSPGQREPNGRLSRSAADQGSDDLVARRLKLAGPNGDPTLTSSAAGVIYCQTMTPRGSDPAQHNMQRHHYDAAVRYNFLYTTLFGKPHASAQNFEACVGHAGAGDFQTRADVMGAKQVARIRQQYNAVCGALSGDEKQMWDSVVVFEQLPEWVGSGGSVGERLAADWIGVAEKVSVALGMSTEGDR